MRRSLSYILVLLFCVGCQNTEPAAYTVKIIPEYDFELTPLQQGLKLFGEYESIKGKPNPSLNDLIRRFIPNGDISTTPWCSAFIVECTLVTGYENTQSLAARSWLNVGECSMADPKPGDIVVLWRESKDSWKGHVGFWIKEKDGEVLIYGGNQGDRVTFMWYDSSRILGIRRLSKTNNNSQYKGMEFREISR